MYLNYRTLKLLLIFQIKASLSLNVYLDSDRFKVLRNVDENRYDENRNRQLDAPPSHRLSGDGGAVVIRVADGHVALVRDGDDDEDGGAKDDVRCRVDQIRKSVAVPVELK